MKTIRQIASEMGVSKPTIRSRITENIEKEHMERIGNTFFISPSGENMIKQAFKKHETENDFAIIEKDLAILSKNFAENIGKLTEIILHLQSEIDVKDKTMANLNMRLDSIMGELEKLKCQSVTVDNLNDALTSHSNRVIATLNKFWSAVCNASKGRQ